VSMRLVRRESCKQSVFVLREFKGEHLPLSLVRGANSSGHRVRQYENSRKAVSPTPPEIVSCVVNQGPSNFSVHPLSSCHFLESGHSRIGGEPGGRLPSSSPPSSCAKSARRNKIAGSMGGSRDSGQARDPCA
jgi:hypothetical protein